MLKTLLKVNLAGLLHSMFNRNKNKKGRSISSKALVGVFAVFIVACLMISIGSVFYSLAEILRMIGLDWLYFAMISIFIFLFTFVGSVFSSQNLIFNAKDNDLLLSMPIPPFYILVSRILLLFILNMMYGLLIAVPAIAVYFIISGFSAVTLILFIIATLLIIIFSSSVTGFLGWLIALVSSRFKKNNLIQTVLSLVFFGVYFIFCMNMQGYIEKLIQNGEVIANTIKNYLPPFYYFGIICTEHSPKALIALALISIIPFALACLLISKSFFKITAGKKSALKRKYVEKELKVSSVKSALLRKELSKFFSLPIYVLNSSTGCLMHIIFTGMLVYQGRDIIANIEMMSGGAFDVKSYVPVVISAVIGLCSSMVNTTAVSTSLEGNRINLVRSMPVTSDDFFFAKAAANLVIGTPTLVVCATVLFFVFGVSPLTAALTLATLLLFFAMTTFINLTANICMPRFTWASEAVIIKQSGSVLVGMLSGFAATMVVFIPYFVLADKISANVYLLCAALVCAVVCLIFVIFIKTSGRKRFEQMCA